MIQDMVRVLESDAVHCELMLASTAGSLIHRASHIAGLEEVRKYLDSDPESALFVLDRARQLQSSTENDITLTAYIYALQNVRGPARRFLIQLSKQEGSSRMSSAVARKLLGSATASVNTGSASSQDSPELVSTSA